MELHRRSNRATADAWERFGEHRARVTALLAEAAPAHGQGSLALLGAGNANDVDLKALVERYAQVHLIDIDADAVARAVAQQPETVRQRLTVQAPVDLSGALKPLADWKGRGPSTADLAGLPDRAHDDVMRALPARYDVVASTGLLSQLLWTCERALGEHPMVAPVSLALAVAHLRSLVALTRAAGRALLITDTVSSETYPVEDLQRSLGPQGLLDEVMRTGVGFRCTHLAFVRQVLREDVRASPLVRAVRVLPPWLWHLVPGQTLLVYAVEIDTRATLETAAP
jgi:hypothetical protein